MTGFTTDMVARMLEDTEAFNRDIIAAPIADKPTMLDGDRLMYAVEHLEEELEELRTAEDLPRQVDALIDLVYVALGRIVEMGVAPGPVFDAVHRANMLKRRGKVEGRTFAGDHDAVKPDNWPGPNFETALSMGLTDLEALSPVLLEITRLRAAKGRDYNSSVDLHDYFPFGHQSYAQLVHMKATRVRSLIEMQARGKTPSFEGIRGSLVDLLNYAVFYVEAIDEGYVTCLSHGGDDGDVQ